MKVLYITNLPSPYMVDFLNEFGKYCELTAIFERSSSTERNKSWDNYKFIHFNGIVLSGLKVKSDKAVSVGILKHMDRKKYHHIIVANPCTPTGILVIEYMKLKKIPYILSSEGGFAKSGLGIKERFKKQLLANASLYFSSCELGDEYFLKYGAIKEKIVRIPYTTLYDKEILKRVLTIEEKASLKLKLGFPLSFMLISVGRFIQSKGFDILFKACKNLPDNIGICIIGGTPTEEYKEIIKKLNLKNIFFYDHLSKEELMKFYQAADLFVLPTRLDTWGLVIIEAMSNGLPVISTDKCVAALSHIKNNENGFIAATEDVNELESKIHYLINQTDLRIDIANNNIIKMRYYTIEEMVNIHMKTLTEYNRK